MFTGRVFLIFKAEPSLNWIAVGTTNIGLMFGLKSLVNLGPILLKYIQGNLLNTEIKTL